jgi:hypothetical protein
MPPPDFQQAANGILRRTARELWEPTTGANALRSSSTDLDPAGPSLQVKGSPLDSLRPGQTPDSCLGVKGSPVQIRPSRLVRVLFRTQKQDCGWLMGAQRAPIQSMKPLWLLRVGEITPLVKGRPSRPKASSALRGALVSGSKGHRFTSGPSRLALGNTSRGLGGIRHSKRWKLSKENARLPAQLREYRPYLGHGTGGPDPGVMHRGALWLGGPGRGLSSGLAGRNCGARRARCR